MRSKLIVMAALLAVIVFGRVALGMCAIPDLLIGAAWATVGGELWRREAE